MSEFMTPDEAQAYVRNLQRAREILGQPDDDVNTAQFSMWLAARGLEGSLTKVVNDEGLMVWTMLIFTERGTVSREMDRPDSWGMAVELLGLD